MKVGLLTGGGDCPGLNAVIRAVVQRIQNAGGSCVGFLEGWRGLVRGQAQELTIAETDGIIARGGTILGSSRTNPYKNADTDLPPLREHFTQFNLDALIAIGGDDTLGVANRLHHDFQFPLIGIPKTIDNDLAVTDFTFGFDTAVNIVIEAIDRLRTTSESHRRVMVVETMGRRSGWLACLAGIASAADYIFVPEVPIRLDHCIQVLQRRRSEGKNYGIVVVSEGSRFPDDGEPILNSHAIRSVPSSSAASEPSLPTKSRRQLPLRPDVSSSATSNGVAPPAPMTVSSPPASASPPPISPSSIDSGPSSPSAAPRSSKRHSAKGSPIKKHSTSRTTARRLLSSHDNRGYVDPTLSLEPSF